MMVVYFGSATSLEGEERRMKEHAKIICLDHMEILVLRQESSGTIQFHVCATLPGAKCRFFATHRFPKVYASVAVESYHNPRH